MENLKNQKILYSGIGNMGLPGLIGLLENPEVNNNDVTIICGSKPHNNAQAMASLLAEKGIEINSDNLISYPDLDVHAIPQPDIVVLGIKPYQLESVLKQYDPIIADDTILLSMLAGTPTQAYKDGLSSNPKVARIMPHVPLASYGLYSDDKQAIETAKLTFTGMGAPTVLSNEDQMHSFTAIAASAPAFIAQFVAKFTDNTMQKHALKRLKDLARGETIEDSATQKMDGIVTDKCISFYNNYLAASQYYLGKEAGLETLQNSLEATASDLQKTDLSLDDYIASVRSKKGTTNAGLLFMGNCCPQNADWGNDEQLASQKKISLKSQSIDCAESIKHAIVSCTNRSIGSGQDASNPMNGVNEKEVLATVEQINKTMLKKITFP